MQNQKGKIIIGNQLSNDEASGVNKNNLWNSRDFLVKLMNK